MRYLALLACVALAPLAHAQGEGGMYIGAGLGTFDYEESEEVQFPLSDTTQQYQIFFGYRFNDHLAIEISAGTTGDLEGAFDATIPEVPELGTVTLELDGNFDIYTAEVLGILPFERFSLIGSIGYASASLGGSARLRGLGDIGVLTGHERGGMASIGLQYDFRLDLRNLSMRGEYQLFDFGSDVDASGVNIVMLFRF